MANFCGQCGTRLINGKCPVCTKGEKGASRRKHGGLLKAVATLLFLCIAGVGAAGALTYFDIVDVPLVGTALEKFGLVREPEDIAEINDQCITVTEQSVSMADETTGTADVLIRMPNYTKLYRAALRSDDPDRYISRALKKGDYETVEFERTVDITVKDGKTTYSEIDTIVRELEEQELIDAIAAVGKAVTNE